MAALLLLVAVAVGAGVFVKSRNSTRDPSARARLTPPLRKRRSTSPPARHSVSINRARELNNEGYAKMRRRAYADALPLFEQAVEGLRGSGSVDEAYADFNLADTRYHLGKCTNVLALLDHSEHIQGARSAIDTLRSEAKKTCA